ncbi:MAG: chemotaxis protein CheW [Desulfomonilia bacterium]|jgi:purine-binding chemotaxis protein CheW
MTAHAVQKDAQGVLITTFSLSGTMFGMDAMRIQEIVGVGEITQVHHAPEFIVGLMNLRGKIVTIIDLAKRLDLASQEIKQDNRVLIVEWMGEYLGLLVENVFDVIHPDPDGVSPPPENIQEAQGKYIERMYQDGKRLITILDVDTVLTEEEQ